ncbi:PH domain-containing protein [Paenibacillus sp. MER TA 81-3]|uniref:PH domain-containing protein n=1 Tax=Paenibacillus sp. MER TA 81-3 TaxID=2939573 RepID=UPI002559898E|nr:PH domain-containing protein [Paenibacillus sp. MER TA 81-3]
MWLPQWKWIIYVSAFYLLLHWSKDLFYIIYGVRFSYARRSYVLTKDEIVIRWGSIWSVNSSVIPLSRVQHVDIEQDVIQKKLGISEVVIVTAGDATGIVGLLEDDANKLRRQVIELAKIGETDAYNP